LAARFGDPARDNALSDGDWTIGRIGLPVLRDGLAYFECRFLHECPAGDHALAVGKVVDGKLLDSRAKPLTYRDTGDLDGASALFPRRARGIMSVSALPSAFAKLPHRDRKSAQVGSSPSARPAGPRARERRPSGW
jgi:flavin reductase (DIM6/NTAB) family NADH-FMN oxidoreductase RutF